MTTYLPPEEHDMEDQTSLLHYNECVADSGAPCTCDPPLTTVALPHYEMGRWATEVALGAREPPAPDQTYLMPCPIIRRDSVSSPPAAAANSSRRRA